MLKIMGAKSIHLQLKVAKIIKMSRGKKLRKHLKVLSSTGISTIQNYVNRAVF